MLTATPPGSAAGTWLSAACTKVWSLIASSAVVAPEQVSDGKSAASRVRRPLARQFSAIGLIRTSAARPKRNSSASGTSSPSQS